MAITRRSLLGTIGKTIIATGALSALPRQAAATGKLPVAVEGVTSWKVGDITCMALLDGVVQVDAAIFRSADATARAELLAMAGEAADKINLDVNAYVLDIGGDLVLIDTGTRDLYGPTLGKVPTRLAAAGIEPDAIDKVVLTHMHNDHVGGLADGSGAAAFRKAELIVPSGEWDFWTSEDAYQKASDAFRYSFAGARQAAPAYAGRVRTFDGRNSEVLPGLHAIDLPGHSIAHTGYRIVSGNDQMIIWGDIVVSPQLQFAHPGWSSDFDADPEKSIASRARMMDEAATDRLLVAGMHLPFPGIGHVVRRGAAYHFESRA